jgi:excinuclease ABC subunit A
VNDSIVIRGARVHNLKNVSLDLPRQRLIVITGVSGSGKSSLAFDTLYAEGQRRYVESLSSYARQFLERMDKPDVDLIQGISPAMAIEQKTNTRNPRSTVGTSTEVYDYLRLLFARAGRTFCSECGKPVVRDSVRTVIQTIESLHRPGENGLKLYVTFPLPVHQGETLAESLANLQKEGFVRIVHRGSVIDLTNQIPQKAKTADVDVLVDRIVFRPGEEQARLADSIETAFASGGGRASILLLEPERRLNFNQQLACADCHLTYEEPDPRLFSFNNPFGACPECQGFGRAIGIDMDLVVPDRTKTLREGAVQPWTTPKFIEYARELARVAPKAGVRMNVPFEELTDKERLVVLDGFEGFKGVYGFFRFVEKKAYKIYYRVLLSRYRGYTTCQLCGGSRLRREALNVRVGGKTIADVVRMTITEARSFIDRVPLNEEERGIAFRVLSELRRRLAYLDDVGIGYLSLERLSSTLSGGESQRINLATSLGSSLVGAVYVLDEPSIGLHPRDNGKLIGILHRLRDVGNTVIVVEHDAEMMMASDVMVDMGPKAGELGGEVVFVGTPDEIVKDGASLTGAYLSGRESIPVPTDRRPGSGLRLTVEGASANNLKGITLSIPLNSFVCVTGVSGSGKSTLVHDVIYHGVRRRLGDASSHPGPHSRITGTEALSAVELVDQSPIGRTPRSNPVTYIHAFDQIRTIFSSTPSAKVHGFKPGHFSFNVPGGRCEACEGDGVVRVEMQFLADLFLPCDVCKGTRFRKEVLDVRYHGKNINEVLGMTVSEAIKFFDADPMGRRAAERLRVLNDVGLGYVRLGQPAPSLSGGEAQRVKLAAHLAMPARGQHTLFIFDEPTTGLHFDDISKLLRCFQALIEAGNSVLIIEHNLDVIKCADHVIDLGPEAGEGGGMVVGTGTPEAIAAMPQSHTGRFLRNALKPGGVMQSEANRAITNLR